VPPTSASRGEWPKAAERPAAPPSAVPVSMQRRSSRRGTRVAAGLALLLALGILAILVASSGSSGPARVRSTSATRGAPGKSASQRRHSSHGSSPAKAGTSRAGSSHAGTSRAGTSRAGTSHAGTSHAGTSQTGGAGREPASPRTRSSAPAGGDEVAAPAQKALPPPPASAPVSGAGSPSTAVQTFYEDAARHDYAAAWQLADGNMRAELAGYESFRAQQSAVRSITFHRAQVTSGSGGPVATVAVQTTAVLADRTEQCSGTVRLLRSSSASWLLDRISINCLP
jgi:hypothetical protein